MRTPTDLDILEKIHDKYYGQFCAYENDESIRASKIYVPISCDDIAEELKVDGDIVFGRLYYHLEKKYGYRQSDGSNVHFFAFKIGATHHCVNFPLLSSVLAGLQQEKRKFVLATTISVISLSISIISIGIAVWSKLAT
ncbi:hypothetical protein CA267_003815 [Alteromonas pelagimontana]|uniref:Uncharacterized protein n=1 Tax=Alteromonas pelagimontana TaxID=1858656 RepID=A0A6M4MAZ2_9ALTE|nr:hypothetical protein [Alteromonas pelagimontana]QJR79968.1 hypothetical protein CA267_003815 [Alteromonas pelagimontana]